MTTRRSAAGSGSCAADGRQHGQLTTWTDPSPGNQQRIQTKLYCSLLRLQRHYREIYASDVASASPPVPSLHKVARPCAAACCSHTWRQRSRAETKEKLETDTVTGRQKLQQTTKSMNRAPDPGAEPTTKQLPGPGGHHLPEP